MVVAGEFDSGEVGGGGVVFETDAAGLGWGGGCCGEGLEEGAGDEVVAG